MGCGASSKSSKYAAKEDTTEKTVPPNSNGEKKTKGVKLASDTDAPTVSAEEFKGLLKKTRSFHEYFDSKWDEKDHMQLKIGSDDIHETVDEIPASHCASEKVLARRRLALSAEAFGEYNKWQELELVETETKSAEQAGRIKDALLKSPLLRPLASRQEDLELAISAFKLVKAAKGDEVITQGNTGTELFMLESGTLDVFVRSREDQAHPGVKVATFDQPGKEFGELALLHNAPRVATIVAREPCTLWSISRKSFNIIMRDHSKARHDRHMGFLRSVKLLEPLSAVQLAQISDAVSTVQYKKDNFVCKEGEIGDCFYMVEEGEAMARINGMDVRSYKRGGYFGELSLINDRPRAADIVAASDELHLVSLDRESFTRLLGDKALFNRASIKEGSPYPVDGGKRRKSVTFAATGSTDSAGEEKPKMRKRGTGFIDRSKLIHLLEEAGEEVDEDEEEGVDSVASATSEVVQTPGKKVGFDAAPGQGVPKVRKQGTGYIDANMLKKLLEEAGEEEDDDEEEDEKKVHFNDDSQDDGRPKEKKRAGTGFISAEQLKKLLEAEEDDEEDEADRKVQFDDESGEGAPKAPVKRGTGFVHIDQLKKLMDEDEDEDEDEDLDEEEMEVHHRPHRFSTEVYVDRASLRLSLGEEYDLPEEPTAES